RLLQAAPSARHFYDVNLREGNWSLALVEQLSAHADVIKLSDSEAEFLDALAAAFVHGLEQRWDTRRLGCFANAVGALVASRPGATPDWNIEECWPMLGERFDK